MPSYAAVPRPVRIASGEAMLAIAAMAVRLTYASPPPVLTREACEAEMACPLAPVSTGLQFRPAVVPSTDSSCGSGPGTHVVVIAAVVAMVLSIFANLCIVFRDCDT